MKHKVADLEGALLDAAVAKAERGALKGIEYAVEGGGDYGPTTFRLEGHVFAPSAAWNVGGPIIERERISVIREGFGDWWLAGLNAEVGNHYRLDHAQVGPTPLTAAMRAHVASKFGEEVELP
jgi:hypothetical protein